MFADRVKITVNAGRGGDGCISFRREKYVPRGGPDGGDGGRGGSIFIVSNPNLFSLDSIRNQGVYKAQPAQAGGKKKRHGSNGENLILEVPPGTIIKNSDTDMLIGELTQPGEKLLVAAGGNGGRGNVHFATPQNRIPQTAETGRDGEFFHIRMDLCLPADVALVGFPGSGKSSLLSAMTNARPRIGDWPFTTRKPMLGVHKINDYSSFRVIDMPALIEGSHEGQGVGNEFLKHLSRPGILLFVLDPASEVPVADQEKILRAEIEAFDSAMLKKQILRIVNKSDAVTKGRTKGLGRKAVMSVSALTGDGVDKLVSTLKRALEIDDGLGPKPVTHRKPKTAPLP